MFRTNRKSFKRFKLSLPSLHVCSLAAPKSRPPALPFLSFRSFREGAAAAADIAPEALILAAERWRKAAAAADSDVTAATREVERVANELEDKRRREVGAGRAVRTHVRAAGFLATRLGRQCYRWFEGGGRRADGWFRCCRVVSHTAVLLR